MTNQIKIFVYRRLDNRKEGLSDQSPRALELHNRRKAALHDVFDSEANINITGWGATNDSNPHEFVVISLETVASVALSFAVVPALKFIGKKLIDKAVDEGTSKLVQWVISKFSSKQENEEILDYQILLPDGTRISIDPPERNSTINIHFNDGELESINYTSE